MNSKPVARDKLAFILYEAKNAPRYFEIKKGLFRFVVFGLPTLSLISIIALSLVGIYLKELRLQAEKKEPEFITQLRMKNQDLLKAQSDLKKLNVVLQEKLSHSVVAPKDQDLLTWTVFKQVPGQTDLSKNPVLSVEEVDAFALNNETLFRFNLVNLTKDNEKVAGFIHVVMKMNNSIHVWPEGSMPDTEMQIPFNAGESFATSRFRPVEAKFAIPKKTSNALFWILVFSRTGDLKHKQIISRTIKI